MTLRSTVAAFAAGWDKRLLDPATLGLRIEAHRHLLIHVVPSALFRDGIRTVLSIDPLGKEAMSRLLTVPLILILAASVGGCGILSSEETDEAPYFTATVGDVELDGVGIGRLSRGGLQVWGQFVHPSGSYRFLQFTLSDFDGEGSYALDAGSGIYGSLDVRLLSRQAFSAGRQEDRVVIDDFDASAGLVRGRFFFYGVAADMIDGFEQDDVLAAAGRFSMTL